MDSHDHWQAQCLPHSEFPANDIWLNHGPTHEPDAFGYDTNEFDGLIDLSVDMGDLVSNPCDSWLPTMTLIDAGVDSPEAVGSTWTHSRDFQSSIPSPQTWSEIKLEPRAKLSISSCDTDFSSEHDHQRPACPECMGTFDNLQSLDHHTKNTSHKAWKCPEPHCSKTYKRRDTFLRHRATHKENNNYTCKVCSGVNKQKVFKRKDHLTEHIRNCHTRGIDAQNSDAIRLVNVYTQGLATDSRNDGGVSDVSIKAEGCTQQQLAMKTLATSLRTVLGDREPNLMGEFDEKMTSLSGLDMQTVAEDMANAALKKMPSSSGGKCDCSCGQSTC